MALRFISCRDKVFPWFDSRPSSNSNSPTKQALLFSNDRYGQQYYANNSSKAGYQGH